MSATTRLLLVFAGVATIATGAVHLALPALYDGLAIFWLFSLGYQVMSPFPHPMVRVIAPVFSLALFVCYAGALFLVRRSSVGAQA